MAAKNLENAKRQKNDEFYTQLSDIEKELKNYKNHFKGKTVLCNCDDPRVSKFFYFFYSSFYSLGLKRLIATCYKNLNPDLFSQNLDEQAVYGIYDGTDRPDDVFTDYDTFIKQNEWGILKGDGDFRSLECIELLKQADIVVTNPPFSLFREYVAQLIEYEKEFIIVGNKNAITYKETFKLIKENKMWIGYTPMGVDMLFDVPDDFAKRAITEKKEGSTYKLIVYFCEGTDSEKLDWFRIINIAGEKLYEQELRNAVYTGAWFTDAKKTFSKTSCVAHKLAINYINGSPIRQDFLETALDWISAGKIEAYMSQNQHEPNANELWLYFQSVIVLRRVHTPPLGRY